MAIPSLVSQAHEKAQAAIKRVIDPSLSDIRHDLTAAAANLYKAWRTGHLSEQDAFRALITIQQCAEHIDGIP